MKQFTCLNSDYSCSTMEQMTALRSAANRVGR